MPNKRRAVAYIEANDRVYGLKTVDKAGKSLRCRFCIVFGREEKPGAQRAPRQAPATWSCPYRYDNIQKHMETNHPEKWSEYKDIENDSDRNEFFQTDTKVPFGNTMRAHFASACSGDLPIVYVIDAPIVDVLIGEMMYCDENDDEDLDEADVGDADALDEVLRAKRRKLLRAKERALQIFVRDADSGAGNDAKCTVTIPKTKVKQFELAVQYVSFGASFRMASNMMLSTMEVLKVPLLRGCSDAVIAGYVRTVCAVNLQGISQVLRRNWTFSLALDSATHQSTSYLDIRVRVFASVYGVQNLHLLAAPIQERHTGRVMFDIVKRVLDVVCPDWRMKLLGCSSDGARNMTGRREGVVTYLSNEAEQEVVRVWCGAHQLDLVMQHVLGEVVKERFYDVLTRFISHLVRQQNLINEMGSTCPNLVNRWLSANKVMTWFKGKRVELLDYIERKKPAQAPPPLWWIYVAVLESFTCMSAETFKKLQGRNFMLSQQSSTLEDLILNFLEDIGGSGPLTPLALDGLDAASNVVVGKFAVSLSNVQDFITGLYSWTLDLMEEADDDAVREICNDIGVIYMTACDRISSIVAERASDNSARPTGASLPPVLPQKLIHMKPIEFIRSVRTFAPRIEHSFGAEQVDAITDEHKKLIRAHLSEPALQQALDALDDGASWESSWGLLSHGFSNLADYCGGLATVFPGTATVKSDFSVLRWEKNRHRKALSDFGLEGVLQCKQFSRLQTLLEA